MYGATPVSAGRQHLSQRTVLSCYAQRLHARQRYAAAHGCERGCHCGARCHGLHSGFSAWSFSSQPVCFVCLPCPAAFIVAISLAFGEAGRARWQAGIPYMHAGDALQGPQQALRPCVRE